MTLACKCLDGSHPIRTALWHRAYCNWFDQDRASRRVRARLWGWLADRLARFA